MENNDKVVNTKKKKEKDPHSFVEIFKKNFPIQDLLVGFIIPKSIFHYLVTKGKVTEAVAASVGWCIVLLIIQKVKTRKIDWFAALALVMIGLRSISILAENYPVISLGAKALDNGLFSILFLGSLFFPKSLIEVFIEKSGGGGVPERIRKSSYFSKCFRIVTLAWGLVGLIETLLILYLQLNHSPLTSKVDFIAGWPSTVILMIFSISFPKRYFHANWPKIEAETKDFVEENPPKED